MKKIFASVAVAAFAVLGMSSAQAADPATLALSGGSATFGLDPAVITATASVPGMVAFSAGGKVIVGCEAVPTTTVSPFVAKCSWVPAAAGAAALTGVLTPTDSSIAKANSATLNVKVGVPVQGVISPIHMYVDTVLGSGTTGALAPRFGVSCAITSEYLVGQTIVFRVYANNADWGGAVMDSSNTAQAYIEISGWPTKIPLTYGNHSGVSFWTGVLKTGTGNGMYSTLGLISFKVTMVAKDTDTMKVLSTKLAPKVVNGVRQVDPASGRTIYERVSYYRSVPVTPALKGATGTWASNFAAYSQLTLYAVPTK
ncbi:MAG: hypothetical protein ACR2H8_00055 [Candidatus Nanopelagicaceae bacterium]|jgi:hypothetical protein